MPKRPKILLKILIMMGEISLTKTAKKNSAPKTAMSFWISENINIFLFLNSSIPLYSSVNGFTGNFSSIFSITLVNFILIKVLYESTFIHHRAQNEIPITEKTRVAVNHSMKTTFPVKIIANRITIIDII